MVEARETDDRQAVAGLRSRALVLYDGQCPLCLKSVALLKRLDKL